MQDIRFHPLIVKTETPQLKTAGIGINLIIQCSVGIMLRIDIYQNGFKDTEHRYKLSRNLLYSTEDRHSLFRCLPHRDKLSLQKTQLRYPAQLSCPQYSTDFVPLFFMSERISVGSFAISSGRSDVPDILRACVSRTRRRSSFSGSAAL